MPRMSLPAAALAVLVAAWSAQPANADSGRSVRKSQNTKPVVEQPAETAAPRAAAPKAQSGETASSKPRFFNPLAKLRQLATGESKSKQIQQVSHEAPSASKAEAKTTAQADKVSTAAYKDEPQLAQQDAAEAPAETPAAKTLPAPRTMAVPPARVMPGMTGPVSAVPAVHPSAHPAYAPLPGHNNAPGYAVIPGYPYLNAPLNTTPVPNVPYQVGSTMITNQALYPQEMLYAHKYRAMYPPYYYKVRGHWMVTPWGVWSNDHWELQGTEVKVNYRSNYSPFSMFTPPHYK